jgi:DtxR family Mn-dependent transcriptional regulator
VFGVKDNSATFLQYVDKLQLGINQTFKVTGRQLYDNLIEIEVNGKSFSVSPRFAENIVIVCKDCKTAKQNKKAVGKSPSQKLANK